MSQATTPLSDEQLQQIRERVSTAVYRKRVHEQRADGSVSEMYTVVYVAQAAHDIHALLAEVERLRTHEGEVQTFAGRLAFYAEAYAVHAEQAGYVGDANVARRVVSEYRAFLAESENESAKTDSK